MQLITHLQTSARFLEKENQSYSQLVVDKFIESCLHLDASIFEPYMEEDDVFEELEKYKFLAELKDLFEYSRLKTDYDFTVSMSNEKCMGCASGKPVVNFEVRFANSKLLAGDFGFLIDKENDILKNIYRCHKYKECHGIWVKPEGLPALFVPKSWSKHFNSD